MLGGRGCEVLGGLRADPHLLGDRWLIISLGFEPQQASGAAACCRGESEGHRVGAYPVEPWLHGAERYLIRSRGSRASRRPSPSRLKARTAVKMAIPGKVAMLGLENM